MTEQHERSKRVDDDPAGLAVDVLEDMKAEHIVRLDVRHLTTITDTMIVATGRSNRHVGAIAEALVERCRERGHTPIGVEGAERAEWVLVDLGDVVVHVMLDHVRRFYDIEKLWDIARARGGAAGG